MLQPQVNDKVQLKATHAAGERGVVEEVHEDTLIVRLDKSGELVRVVQRDITNFSLAARKAWEKMPDRRVGRPKGSRTSDRVSVTLRINRELWQRFKQAESDGTIADRTKTINEWLGDKLDELFG